MICEYITRYLLLNKRLVVPNLGAFVVNPSNGNLIFVELLKQDDGVLMRQLMADGLSAVDAMNMIDRFVFEIRYKVESGGTAMLNGIGRLSMAEDGLYRFEYDPEVGRQIAVPATAIEEPTLPEESTPESPGEPIAETPAEPAPEPIAEPEPIVEEQPAEPEPEPEPEPQPVASQRLSYERSSMEPESYVKGLRYGKPQRPSKDDIRYVGHSSGRGVDKFVIVAIVAALLAVGAIVYGWLNTRNQEDIYGYDEESIELFDEATEAVVDTAEQTK